MANENRISVEFFAKTDAAIGAVKPLTDAIRANTTAAAAAGKEQAELGKQVSETRVKQLASTEANRAAKQAMETLSLTVVAYGAKSREAAAASDRLAQAQARARVAATEAAEALERTGRAASAAAKAEDGALTPATKRAAAQLGRMATDADRTAQELRKMDLQMTAAAAGAGRMSKGLSALGVAGGVLVAGGVSRAVHGVGEAMGFTLRSAIEMESGMADVAKVVSGLKTPAGEATGEYRKMEQALFDMSERIAVAPEGFAKMAAAAGQAGIAGSGLIEFTEDAAKTAVAFEITAEKAGDGLAKLRTSLQYTQPQVRELAGTMNVLSNDLAATAPDILDATLRVGAIGKATNITGGEIAALSAAMLAAGASAEQAGTGTKNFILALAIGSSATKHQTEAFQALGLSAEKVAENVTSRDGLQRAQQMQQVVQRIAELGDKDRVAVMSKLFGKETIGTIGPLATNLELLTTSLETARDRTAALGSVQAEFASRSNTTANTLQLLKNSLSVTAITIGNELLPELSDMAKEMSAWVKQNRDLIRENVVGFIHGVSAAVKGLAPYLMGAAKAAGLVIDMLGGMERAIGPLTLGLGALRLASTLALGPWGLLAAGIVAGAVAIGQEMADAERRTMSLIQAAGRLKDIGMTGAGLEGKSAQELLAMRADLDAERKRSQTIDARTASGFASPERLKQRELERQADIVALDARQKLIDAALATKTSELETSINIRKENERTAAAEAMRADKLKLELEYLNSLDQRSAAQERRRKALDRVGVEDIGEEKKGRKGGARRTAGEMAAPGDVARTRIFDGREDTELIARGAPEAAANGRAEAEQARFDAQMLRYDREAEMMDAQGTRERERVDMIFWSLDIEDEAEIQRTELQDQRLGREQEYARWQLRNARTETQREQAQTRLEDVEHRKRLVNLTRAAEAERVALEKRKQIVESVTGQVSSLTSVMVDGIQALINGQRGALARALADWTQDLAKRSGLRALEEFMLAAVSAASYNYPAAAAHTVAGGMALGVAAAAGAASAGLGAAASARGGGAGGTAGASGSAGGGAAANDSGRGSSAGAGAATGRSLERMDVPVSYDRGAPMSTGPNVVIQIGTFVGNKNSARDLGEQVKRSLAESRTQGYRP